MDFKLIGGTVAAVVMATVVLCLLGGLTRRRWTAGAWAVLLALAVAPLAADQPLLGERPQWRSTDPDHADGLQRVILAAAPLSLAALALAGRRLPAWPRGVLAAAGPAVVVYWIVRAYPGPPLAGWPARLAGPAVVSAVLWVLVEPIAVRRPHGIAAPWVCGCLAAGVGFLNLFGSTTGPGWTAAAVGGVVGAAFLFALTGRGPSFAGGPVGVVVALLVCLVMASRLGGGEVPASRWVLLAVAPAVAWVGEVRPVRDWRPWVREPLRMVLVAAPVVAAVVPAYRQYQREQAAEQGGPGWSVRPVLPYPAAPTLPRATPMASTISPPTITCTTVFTSGVAM